MPVAILLVPLVDGSVAPCCDPELKLMISEVISQTTATLLLL